MFKTCFVVFIICACFFGCHGRFKMRKCCKENEFLSNDFDNCKPYKNSTVQNDTRPWWFPDKHNIFSTTTHKALDGFPVDLDIVSGVGAPCCETEKSHLPASYFDFVFYEDGSMKLFDDTYQTSNLTYPPHSFCVDRFLHEDIGLDFIVSLCPCATGVCLYKCCEHGSYLEIPESRAISAADCKFDWKDGWKPSGVEDSFIIPHLPKCDINEQVVLTDLKTTSHEFTSNGSVFIDDYYAGALRFCVDYTVYASKDTAKSTSILWCKPVANTKIYAVVRRLLYASLSAIGAIFLILILITYALMPRELTVNDKNLIAQTWSLLIGYIVMAISQFAIHHIPHFLCVIFGFIMFYAFLASFFWLNVLCIDLAWAFSELRLIRSLMVWQNRKRYFQYSLYAWLSPAIIVLVAIIIDFTPNAPDTVIKPGFTKSCWFPNDSLAMVAYFYGPIAVLLTSNIILFLYTAVKIRAAQQQASTLLQNNAAQEKKRIILYMKLFCLMGLSWIFELVSWAVGGPEYYWYGPDMVNLLRAIFMFITLCCKREVLDELKIKFKRPNCRGRTTASPSVVTLASQFSIDQRTSQTASSSF